jgi:hypothetical protein
VGNALLNQVTRYAFHNLSQLTFESLLRDPNQLAANAWGVPPVVFTEREKNH